MSSGHIIVHASVIAKAEHFDKVKEGESRRMLDESDGGDRISSGSVGADHPESVTPLVSRPYRPLV